MTDAVDTPGFEVGPWGWQCEDCPFFTLSEDEAGAHSDARKHSLARCPENKRKPKNDSKAKRAQRKRAKVRQAERISELESQLRRALKIASLALERVEVATDPSGAADEAAALLRQVATLDGAYVPHDAVQAVADGATMRDRRTGEPFSGPEHLTCMECGATAFLNDDPIHGWVGYPDGMLCPACEKTKIDAERMESAVKLFLEMRGMGSTRDWACAVVCGRFGVEREALIAAANPDEPMFEPPELDADMRAGRAARGVIDPNREPA